MNFQFLAFKICFLNFPVSFVYSTRLWRQRSLPNKRQGCIWTGLKNVSHIICIWNIKTNKKNTPVDHISDKCLYTDIQNMLEQVSTISCQGQKVTKDILLEDVQWVHTLVSKPMDVSQLRKGNTEECKAPSTFFIHKLLRIWENIESSTSIHGHKHILATTKLDWLRLI